MKKKKKRTWYRNKCKSTTKKKVKDLQMLSGGERALTSIALIFAMSSINHPPFMVLDETDAALDEGMLENMEK